ncbi:terpene synthase family protein [Streptomyces sp. T028]|uniref:terpene synthase family protein n=1 Tax=Streptomyces sp. T028 TaxID=3394379 RepID=UPI003A8C3933
MPHIHVEFPPELSPHAEQAEAGTRAFVARHGLAPDEAARRHHERSLLGTLMGRAYPHAEASELQLVTDWISTMLVLDDQFDETSLGTDPARLREVCDEVLSWFTADGSVDDAAAPAPAHSVTAAFRPAYAELWRRTVPLTSPTWRARLAGHIGAFFETCVWESENRLTGRVPDLDEYIAMRGRALMPYLDLIEVTTHTEVPEEIYGLPEFAEMNAALSDADLWTNDLFSCEKEALLGDPHNLVLVHQHAQGTDLQTSADAVGVMIQGRFDRFTELSASFADRLTPELRVLLPTGRLERHIAGLRSWLTGQLQWRFETLRFDPTRPEVTRATGSTPL